MSDFTHIRQHVFNRPWAVTQDYLDIIADVVVNASTDFASGKIAVRKSDPKSGLRVQDGVPIIEVDGVISKKMNLFTDVSGGTSIEQLSAQFDEAMGMEPRAIILNIHSPGGSVDGIAEMANSIFDARQSDTTIIALADNVAASAAYWLGAQADEFLLVQGGSVGSIGIIARLMDNTRQLKNEGIDPIIIRSSELKAAGVGPMSPAQENSVIREVATHFELFKADVRRARPQMNMETAATGEMFIGQRAIDAGLADGFSTLRSLVKRYAKKS